jgi:hypothetical protein
MAALGRPQARIIGLILAWKVFDVIFPSIHTFAINLLYLGQGRYQL